MYKTGVPTHQSTYKSGSYCGPPWRYLSQRLLCEVEIQEVDKLLVGQVPWLLVGAQGLVQFPRLTWQPLLMEQCAVVLPQ